ncbi:hypothetical protein [Spirillospora sp. CA-294931]|uniref:hypothetical protein n=1 Tax=Spirillospora sp. CA-294931 TaxID=3240042 RepID=UPI003D93ABFD
MADATEDQAPDRIDDLMLHLARGRVALGVAAFAVPGLTVKALGLGRGSDPGRDYVTRMFAAREIALGAGYLLSRGPNRRIWARLGLMVDGLDTVNGAKSRQGLPLWLAAGATGVAAACTALGAAKVGKDIMG